MRTGAMRKGMKAIMRTRTLTAALILIPALILCLGTARLCLADTGWPQRFGGSSFDAGNAMTRDVRGNLYITGQFQGTATFGATTLTSRGVNDVFVGKIDAAGNWLWVVQAGGSGDDAGFALAVDVIADTATNQSEPNIYLTGTYQGSNARFGNIGLPSASGYDVFVAKLDGYGNWVWANSASGANFDYGLAITVNEVQEVFVAGQMRYDLTFPRSAPAASISINAYQSLQATPSCGALPLGDWSYCYPPASGGCGPCYRNGGDCDGDSECQPGLVCRYDVGADYGTDPAFDICGRPGEATNSAGFVAKLSSGGEWQWALKQNGTNLSSTRTNGIAVKHISIGTNVTLPQNIIYISGTFQENLTLVNTPSSGAPTSYVVTSNPLMRDVFVAKLMEDGPPMYDIGQPKHSPNPYWVWLTDSDSTGAADEIWANGLAMDDDGNLFVAGGYKGAPALTATALHASGSQTAAYAARLFDNGASATWLWSKEAVADGAYNAEAVSLTVDGQTPDRRNVYVAGNFQNLLNYDYDVLPASPQLTARGGMDLFVAKYAVGDGEVQWAKQGGLQNNEYLDLEANIARGGIVADTTGTTVVTGGFDVVTSLIDGGTMSFAGETGQFVQAPQNVSETDYSVSLWFKTTYPGRGIFTVISANAPSPSGWDRELYLDTEGNVGARVWNNEVIRTTGSNFADGQWHHLVHTFGGSAGGQKLYVDGLERAAGAMTASNFTWQTSYVIGFSMDAANRYFKGKIANVQVGSSLTDDAVWAAFMNPANQPGTSAGKLLFSSGNRDGFLGSLSPDGKWRESEVWMVGQEVPKPAGAAAMQPDITPDTAKDFFYWSRSENKLYSIWEASAVVKWRVSTLPSVTDRIVTTGSAFWPEQPQIHVAGVPVDVQPQASTYYYTGVQRTDSSTGADDSATNASGGKVLTATGTGYTVLRYGVGNMDLEHYPVAFEVVRTLPWDDPSILEDGAAATIGQRLTDASHTDPNGRNGYVYFTNSYYDGYGENRAYDRATRSGPIIPVNREKRFNQNDHATTQATGKDFVVVWFQTNQKNVAWPVRPVRYDVRWPLDPYKIVIASELGSDVYDQPVLDPEIFPTAQVYRQTDAAQPGYNPNEEHASLFPSATGNGFDAVFALRNDLHDPLTEKPSLPYVLLKYKDPGDNNWAMQVYQVLATDANYASFSYQGTAGTPIFPPYPVRLLNGCPNSHGTGDPYWQDRVNFQYWAKSAGTVTAYYSYPLLTGFDYAGNPSLPMNFTGQQGDCVSWRYRQPSNLVADVTVLYDIKWPADTPVLQVGETLLAAKRGLPDIMNQAATEVVYDQLNPTQTDPANTLVQLIDPLSTRWVSLAKLPSAIGTTNKNGMLVFNDLPFHLQVRVKYDPLNHRLGFNGYYDASGMGDPLLLLNVMSGSERDEIKALSTDAAYTTAVNDLFYLTRNPQKIKLNGSNVPTRIEAGQQPLNGFQDLYTWVSGTGFTGTRQNPAPDGVIEALQALGSGYALTAGAARGTGYVTLAFNNDPSLGSLPVSLKVIRVDCGPYLGEIKVIQSDNVFDEKLTLRHSGDFGGNPENFSFEWYYHPDTGGFSPTPLPSPETSQLNGWLPFAQNGAGVNYITIRGASLQTLSDNWFYVRYRRNDGVSVCNNDDVPTPWAGAPGSTAANPSAQLAEGWIKRVVRSLNAYEARVKDFHAAPTNTYASMLIQAGERYEGDVAMNSNPDNLNGMGLISAYETVLRRGMSLSIDGTPPINYAPANNALLLAASRIADFYTLLGNEAYADAADPTIGFGTQSGEYGTAASSIFAFENQVDSLLEEELTLLRGRDYTAARPIFNRLVWNFTSGEGEVAYSQVYGISDDNGDGFIDEKDARIQYPQGHGDAWGHYLTSLTTYYKLLRHPYYTWDPRAEAVLVAGAPVMVDYLDERHFARMAAAKAKVGAEIVDLTYRENYVDDPAGQWQGYKDSNSGRAWGLAEWGRRAGQAAYFDWVTANAILPSTDTDPTHVYRIQKIDRSTVLDLSEMRGQYASIQKQLDKADGGLSPLGLAKGVVPFDIDPAAIDAGQTHFEQIYTRAEGALDNAVSVFDYANQMSQMLRKNQDSLEDFAGNVSAQDGDYQSRLIELYGTPYAGDIGGAGTYSDGYDGPDFYHYMWINDTELTGDSMPVISTTTDGTATPTTLSYNFLTPASDPSNIPPGMDLLTWLIELVMGNKKSWTLPGTVSYTYNLDQFKVEKPANLGIRRTEGELQRALGDVYRSRANFQAALLSYDDCIKGIQAKYDQLVIQDNLNNSSLQIMYQKEGIATTYNVFMGIASGAQVVLNRIGKFVGATFTDASHCVPDVIGFSNSLGKPVACTVEIGGNVTQFVLETIADVVGIIGTSLGYAKEISLMEQDIHLARTGQVYQLKSAFYDLEALIRQEPGTRLAAFQAKDAVLAAIQHYYDLLSQGERLIEEMATFRASAAAEVQKYRYQDMTFRVFRNDAIQKYRAQFDLAARYTYLAATAYDYETNLLYEGAGAGEKFLTDIVRERNLGQVIDGLPIAGSPGLADPLARLRLNFDVLKGQLGFNNPQTETNRFSLRSELFRIGLADAAWPDPYQNPAGNESATLWSEALQAHRVDDLWAIPEFRRFCRPFTIEENGPQPGLVIPFGTTVKWGLNYFGWPLGGGDNSYDPTNFATRVRSAGVWFSTPDGVSYASLGISNTPRIYLVPAGLDILRSPTSGDMNIRSWQVVDQKLPVPFPIGASDLIDPGWIPVQDSLSDLLGGVRRFSSFRAYHDSGDFDPAETVADSRLVGRSVWNTKWLLIIPGGTLHYDPDVGLDRFIGNDQQPGVSDIKIFFQTYGYSGD